MKSQLIAACPESSSSLPLRLWILHCLPEYRLLSLPNSSTSLHHFVYTTVLQKQAGTTSQEKILKKPNPMAPPNDAPFVQDCDRVAGCTPGGTGHDKHITSIVLNSGASANSISQKVVEVARLQVHRVSSSATDECSTFELYIGGVKACITAYIDPQMSTREVMTLGMPGRDAFLMGLERTSYPEREFVATVATEVKGRPDRRFVVPRVDSNTKREITIVPRGSSTARQTGVEVEDSSRDELI